MSIATTATPQRAAQPVVIALVDDAAHLQMVWPAMSAPSAGAHWVVVACAPRMAQRPSKWGSHRVREHWRARWSAKLFNEVGPWLNAKGHDFTPILAEGPLPELTSELMRTHDTSNVIDLRRPKGDGMVAAPVSYAGGTRLFSLVASLFGIGLLLGGVVD
jgi:hypothetical protein